MKIAQVRLKVGEIEGSHTGYYRYEFCTFDRENLYDSSIVNIDLWHELPSGLDQEEYDNYAPYNDEETRYGYNASKKEIKVIGEV